jgi:hypothetical protein
MINSEYCWAHDPGGWDCLQCRASQGEQPQPASEEEQYRIDPEISPNDVETIVACDNCGRYSDEVNVCVYCGICYSCIP